MIGPCPSCGLYHDMTDTDPACGYECHPECGPELLERDGAASWQMWRCSATIGAAPRERVGALTQGPNPPMTPEGLPTW